MSELLYRESLREKLLDLSGELRTGRDAFTISSELYKKLDGSIQDVIRILEDHEGEERLSEPVRAELEEKIRIMKANAAPYRDSKFGQGALADPSLATASEAERIRVTRVRFNAANDLLKIDSRIPRDPGAETGIIAPDRLEPGDRPETNWRLKWKQNVRYLAKKQIASYERRSSAVHPSARLEQEEFDALMDFTVQGNALAYKDDAKLCQKYPKLRLNLDKALIGSAKLHAMTDREIGQYMERWAENALEKAVSNAEKEKRRKGQTFTEKDREKVRQLQEIRIRDQMKKFGTVNKLISAGDVLEQQARFLDLKMKVISDKNYVRYPHTNTLGRTCSVSDYEALARNSRDAKEKQFYQNLRDLRELEDAGIRHLRPASGIDTALYRKVDESVHKTVKRDFLSFRVKESSLNAFSDNSQYGATQDSTKNKLMLSKDAKLRMGKIGLKLHSKHKSLQLSGGLAFGQVKTSAAIGANLNSGGAEASLSAEAAAVRARIKAQASGFGIKGSVGAGASIGHAFGKLSAGIGSIKVKDSEGKEHTEIGITAEAGGVAAAVKGSVGGTLSLFGLKIGLSLTGYGGAVGAQAGFKTTLGGVGLSLGGALGIGVGLKININWSEAVQKVKTRWRNSKLAKLISNYKERKKVREKESFEEAKKSIGKKPELPEEGGMKSDRRAKDERQLQTGVKKPLDPNNGNEVQRSMSF